MTDILLDKETTDVEHAGTSPQESADPGAPSLQHETASPPELSPSGVGDTLTKLTVQQLGAIVGIAMVGLAIAALVAAGLVVSWIQGSANDNAKWAAAEAHAEDVHELATQQFLAAALALRTNDGLSFAVQEQGDQLAARIDELMVSVAAISSDAALAEGIASLHLANNNLTTAGVEGIEKSKTNKYGDNDYQVFEVELAFAEWRRAYGDFSTQMSVSQAANLTEQADRADTALYVLAGLAVLAMAILAAARSLATRARKRDEAMQQKLRAERKLLRTIVSELPESIGWKDADLRLLGCNPALAGRLAKHGIAEPPYGQRISIISGDDLTRRYVSAIEELESSVVRSGQPSHANQVTLRDSTGSLRTTLRSVVPLKEGGQVVGIVSTGRDITDIVNLERSLAAAGRLESIGQLSAGVAHEINTPVQFLSDNTAFLDDSFKDLISAVEGITKIACDCNRGLVEELKKDLDLDYLLEEIPDAITQSREGLEQISEIVRAMKDFSSPGGDCGPADINKIIKNTVQVSKNEWKYNSEMELDLDKDLPNPHCDEAQMKQVLLNMIVNATHAITDSDRDRGTISIATSSTPTNVTIQISDTGCGMTDEVRDRAFERFFTTKDVGRGSGQGLSIAYDAITSHGGTISVDSTVDVGTTFAINIPIEPSPTT